MITDFECVPNASEGRDREVVDSLAAAAGATLLDVHADADHHRSVYTLGGALNDVATGVRRLAEQAFERIDVTVHEGVHPRRGALDVVPFVALDPANRAAAVEAAQHLAGWLAGTLGVPVFLYGGADPAARSLPEVRRGAFDRYRPDHGPAEPHPTFGAVVVGERPVLVAVNCRLDRDDLATARDVASAVRERDGGLPGVRALGFRLASRNVAEVSMNVTDLDRTSVEAACTEVRERVREHGREVTGVELVGLVPEAEFDSWSEAFRTWSAIERSQTIEARLAR